eukprot:222604_1
MDNTKKLYNPLPPPPKPIGVQSSVISDNSIYNSSSNNIFQTSSTNTNTFSNKLSYSNNDVIPHGLPSKPSTFHPLSSVPEHKVDDIKPSIPDPIIIESSISSNKAYIHSECGYNSNTPYSTTTDDDNLTSKTHNLIPSTAQNIVRCSHRSSQNPTNNNKNNNKNQNNNDNNNNQNKDKQSPNNNQLNGNNNNTNNNNNNNRKNGDDGKEDKHNDDNKEENKYEYEEKELEEEMDDEKTNKHVFSYKLNGLIGAQGVIKISTDLTEIIIPNMIRENINRKMVYNFVNKSTAICVHEGKYYDNEQFKIFNYGFHNKFGAELYCVADKKKGRYSYKMRDTLFTKNQILEQCGVKYDNLPICISDLKSKIIHDNINKIRQILLDQTCFNSIICNIKQWSKVPVYTTMNKAQSTEINKSRRTFSITKNEFLHDIHIFVNNDKNVQLIPIAMFNCNGYRLEYVHIVKFRKNIHIGISYIYDKLGVKVSGIHVNKDNIMIHHQLVFNHECHCLDGFQSNTDDFHIGNCDEDENRYKALKKALKNKTKEVLELQKAKDKLEQTKNKEISELKVQLKSLTFENERLQLENKNLNSPIRIQHNDNNSGTLPSWSPFTNSSSHIVSYTPITSSTYTPVHLQINSSSTTFSTASNNLVIVQTPNSPNQNNNIVDTNMQSKSVQLCMQIIVDIVNSLQLPSNNI